MLVSFSVIDNIVVLSPSFLLFSPTCTQFYSQLKRAFEPRKYFIMPGHYKIIMLAQQPIRARVLLQPYNKKGYTKTIKHASTAKYNKDSIKTELLGIGFQFWFSKQVVKCYTFKSKWWIQERVLCWVIKKEITD